MNFFKSVFSDDQDPPILPSESPQQEVPSPKKGQPRDSDVSYGSESPTSPAPNSTTNPNPDPSSRWNFGGLIKTLTTKSESVLDTYRRDLQEFSSGLRKEIEVAQGSLGTVGSTIDEFGSSVLKGTAEIISQGKEAILSVDLSLDDASDSNPGPQASDGSSNVYDRYSRFEAHIRAIQGDPRTYSDDPEDVDDFSEWKLKFDLAKEEIEALLDVNSSMKSLYDKIVPSDIDHETFWCRYFYRVHKVKQAEIFRAKLVNNAISREEEEELSWDVYDDEDGSEVNTLVKEKELDVAKSQPPGENADLQQQKGKEIGDGDGDGDGEVKTAALNDKEENAVASESKSKDSEDVVPETDKSVDSNTAMEKCSKDGESAKEEEELGWDDIEDLSCIDNDRATSGSTLSPKKAELRKRLSAAAEEEEDLSWDIEDDDDEP